MNLVERIWRSSLGKKYVMAVTGLALFGFVVGHLAGNLQVFGPPEAINGYAHFLKSRPLLLWGARLGLLACVGLHVVAAITLSALNKAARPVGYGGVQRPYAASLGSRTMLLSGLVILAFVVYHLLHFTAQQPGINGVGDFSKLRTTLHGEPVADVYAMMILGFQVWWVALFYLLAQALLFLHLGHGLASVFQSLGLRNHVWWPRVTLLARALSVAIFLGYASIPVAVLGGLGGEHARKAKAQAQLAAAEAAGAAPALALAGKEGK